MVEVTGLEPVPLLAKQYPCVSQPTPALAAPWPTGEKQRQFTELDQLGLSAGQLAWTDLAIEPLNN